MSNIIEIKNITKEFKVLNRREGLKGSLKDLFSRDYKIVRAVDNISMSIKRLLRSQRCWKIHYNQNDDGHTRADFG